MPVKSLWTAPVLAFLLACTDPVTLSADLGDEESLINVNVSEDASDTPLKSGEETADIETSPNGEDPSDAPAGEGEVAPATETGDAGETGDAWDDAPDPAGDPAADPAGDLSADPPGDGTADGTEVPALTLAAFEAAVAAGDAFLLQGWLAGYDMPLCEGDVCLIVTTLPAGQSWQAARVAGDFDAWQGTAPLHPIDALPPWVYAKITVQFTTWTEYKLHFGDGTWGLDLKDRYIRFAQFGPNSAIYRPGLGRLARIADVASAELGNVRDLYAYLPAVYFADPAAHLPVFYLQDGFNVFQNPAAPFGTWDTDLALDALVAQGLAQPVILVGIDTHDRMNEYLYTSIDPGDGTVVTPKLPAYADFVAGTVKTTVDATFRTLPDRDHTAIGGSSLGGISALWMAWMHATTFSRVASFSGSFWVGEDAPMRGGPSMRQILADNAASVAPGSLRIYLDAGDTDAGGVTYGADAWAESDWTRNELIALGWDNRPEWDTDTDLSTPPADLPLDTATASVPALAWQSAPPAPYQGWADWLALEHDLLAMVGPGQQHNETAWKQRFPEALVFLFPGPAALATAPKSLLPQAAP